MVKVSRGQLKALLSLIMIFLPRSALTYPAYCVAPLLMVDWRKAIRPQAGLVLLLIVSLYFAQLSTSVSISVAILEYALCFAFFLGVFGAEMRIPGVSIITMTRAFSVIIAVTSLFSLVQQGFPARLPYIDFLPDYYYATFGLGGAKTVTVLSYVSIISEIVNRKLTKKIHNGYLFLALFNFIMPSFIIGILCGILSGCVIIFKRPLLFLAAGLLFALIAGPYVLFRLETVSGGFSLIYGSHPKIYQFVNAYEFYRDNSNLIFTGSGIGQYAGQATFWASPIGQILSSFRLPELPGMLTPEVHVNYMSSKLEIFLNNTWAINSTSNRPYSSISVIIVEFGFLLSFVIFARIFWMLIMRNFCLEFTACFIFVMALMVTDRVHDTPWFGISLIIMNGLVTISCNQSKNTQNTKRVTMPRIAPSRVMTSRAAQHT